MKYNIKDAEGNITNTIVSDAGFVDANFEHYEVWTDPAPTPVEPTAEEKAREWRDSKLAQTDYRLERGNDRMSRIEMLIWTVYPWTVALVFAANYAG